jgi:hypothetical protein
MEICNLAYTLLALNINQSLFYNTYYHYGNNCGLGNYVGNNFVDDIDACCFDYNKCNKYHLQCNLNLINCVSGLDRSKMDINTLNQQIKMIVLFGKTNQLIAKYLGYMLNYSDFSEFDLFISLSCDTNGHFMSTILYDSRDIVKYINDGIMLDNPMYLMLLLSLLLVYFQYQTFASIAMLVISYFIIRNILILHLFNGMFTPAV